MKACKQATFCRGTQLILFVNFECCDLSILFLQALAWINPCVNVSTAQDFVQAVAIKIGELAQLANIGNIVSNRQR